MPDFVMDVKGREFLEAFVDPGPPYDPAVGPDAPFFQAVVEQAPELVLAFGHDATITYANDAVRVMLGHDPAALIGTSALDLVAPDDLENAATTVEHAAEVEGWRPPRPIQLLHADGRAITFDVTGISLFHDPRVRSIVIIARWADTQTRVDRVIGLLGAQRPIDEVLAELVHLLHRPGWRLAVALQHDVGDGVLEAVTSVGGEALSGLATPDEGPWATARRTGRPVVDIGMATVPAEVRGPAEAAGFTTCWAIPVPDPGGWTACLVVWNAESIEPELGQDLVLRRLLDLVGLALDGRARAKSLERAAHCDPLTGLWNRRYLESAWQVMGRRRGDRAAVLVCDLDGFKQVNDELGHPAGDLVVRTVADRLRATVRDSDVVARLGGDEFALLCPDLGTDDVAVLAGRIIEAVTAPIAHPGGAIRVGISIGAVVGDLGGSWDLDHLVRYADAHLLAAKAAGKGTFRLGVLAPD